MFSTGEQGGDGSEPGKIDGTTGEGENQNTVQREGFLKVLADLVAAEGEVPEIEQFIERRSPHYW